MKIEHDFHIHTDLSLCAKKTATVENYIEQAKKNGLNKLGFANHFWDEKIKGVFDPRNLGVKEFYETQNFEYLSKIKPQISKAESEGIKMYFGCEAEYDFAGRGVGITEETAEKFDFIVVSNSHTHMTMPKELYEPYEKHAEFMITAYEDILDSNVSKFITAVAHPFGAVCCPYDQHILMDMISDDCYKRLFDKTANKGIAFEINLGGFQNRTKEEIETCSELRLYRLAKNCGCKFIFGSDAHCDTDHDTYFKADIIADFLELSQKDLADIAL